MTFGKRRQDPPEVAANNGTYSRNVPKQRSEEAFWYSDVVARKNRNSRVERINPLNIRSGPAHISAFLVGAVCKSSRARDGIHQRQTGTIRKLAGPLHLAMDVERRVACNLYVDARILDDAAIASIEKAAPFPAFPETLKVDKIVEVVPYRFSVR